MNSLALYVASADPLGAERLVVHADKGGLCCQ